VFPAQGRTHAKWDALQFGSKTIESGVIYRLGAKVERKGGALQTVTREVNMNSDFVCKHSSSDVRELPPRANTSLPALLEDCRLITDAEFPWPMTELESQNR